MTHLPTYFLHAELCLAVFIRGSAEEMTMKRLREKRLQRAEEKRMKVVCQDCSFAR